MKKEYKKPAVGIMLFYCEDVITSSGSNSKAFMDSLVQSGDISGYNDIWASDYSKWADE